MAIKTRKKLDIERRRKVVAANVLAGATYREIAASEGVSVGTIARDVKAILKDLNQHYRKDAKEWRTIQLRRTDVMLNAIWEHVRNGSLIHIDRALKLIAQQDKYLGIHDVLEVQPVLKVEWVDPLGDDDPVGVGVEELNLTP